MISLWISLLLKISIHYTRGGVGILDPIPLYFIFYLTDKGVKTMSKFSAFMKKDLEKLEKEYVISDRFVDEAGNPIKFKLKPMPAMLEKLLSKECRTIKNDGTVEFDSEKYENEITENCVVYPDLRDVELQDFYGVQSVADLLNEMLNIGENRRLQEAIQDINGIKSFGEKVKEAKN